MFVAKGETLMNNKRELKKMQPLLKKVNGLRKTYSSYTDEQLKLCAIELREKCQKEGGSAILPDAFALVREASKRALGKEPLYVLCLQSLNILHTHNQFV